MGVGDLFNNLLTSLTSKDEGFSFRKLASVVVLGMVVYLHIEYVKETNVTIFLLYDFGFIAVLLGLLNLDRFVQAKWGQSGSPDATSDATSDKPVE